MKENSFVWQFCNNYKCRALTRALTKRTVLTVSMTIVLFFIRYFLFQWNLEAKNEPQFTHISYFFSSLVTCYSLFPLFSAIFKYEYGKKSSNKSSWELGEMKRRNKRVKRFLSRSSWCTFIIIKHGKCYIIMNGLFTLTEPI